MTGWKRAIRMLRPNQLKTSPVSNWSVQRGLSLPIAGYGHVDPMSNASSPMESMSHRRKCITRKQNRKNTMTPPQKIHLSCLALLSTMRIVSPLTPSVFATLYSFRWVPFSISR